MIKSLGFEIWDYDNLCYFFIIIIIYLFFILKILFFIKLVR